jgi:hypothetical protein
MRKVMVEIWMAGARDPVYDFEAQRIEGSIDGTFMRITSVGGIVYEVSPHNLVIREFDVKGGGGDE